MPGTFVFRPIEATLTGEAARGSYSRSLDALCKVTVGDKKRCTHPSKCFGIYPEWDETLLVPEGEKNNCTISLEDNNKMNPNRRIGEFDLDLEDVYNKGKVTKWFDILKKDRVQGQLLMEVTYTQANLRSKLFHQGILPGAAVAATNKPFDYYVHHPGSFAKSARKEVEEELEHVHEHELTSPSTVNKLKDPTLSQLHLDKNNPTDTGTSNPNTMKLGTNHPNVENDPSSLNIRKKELAKKPQTKNQALHLKKPGKMAQKDKKEIQKHLSTSPPSRVNQLRDPTLNQLHLEKGNLADTGMSNPNTMKLGVNHPKHDPSFNIGYRELAKYPSENPNYYDENDDIYHADTGMSNPNVAGLSDEQLKGLQVAAMVLPEYRRRPHLPEQPHGPFEIDKITTAYDTSLGAFSHPRDSWTSGISNPNTITEGINHRPGDVKTGLPEWVEPYYHPTAHHHEPFEVDKITRVNDTSLGRASYQGTPQEIGMSNPKTMKMGVNERSTTVPSYEQTKELAERSPNSHMKSTFRKC